MNTDDKIEYIDPSHYGAMLDEIYRLRCAFAYEAGVTKAHLDYATFPKSRRVIATEQIDRMRAAARGECESAYQGVSPLSMQHCLREAGAPETVTRNTWETSPAINALRARLDEASELQALFDMQWERMTEATARWRAEDPDARALISPDLGALLQWLMDKAGER